MNCKKQTISIIIYSLISPFYFILFFDYTPVFHTKPIPMMVPSEISIVANWKLIILQILQDAFFFNNIESNSVLLVNMIKNDTCSNIQTNKITDLLIKCILENTKKYQVIRMEQLYCTYRKLGIFPEHHINSYNFSINIANYLQADYVLYGVLYGDSVHPILELQLILVKTGEILNVINTVI